MYKENETKLKCFRACGWISYFMLNNSQFGVIQENQDLYQQVADHYRYVLVDRLQLVTFENCIFVLKRISTLIAIRRSLALRIS